MKYRQPKKNPMKKNRQNIPEKVRMVRTSLSEQKRQPASFGLGAAITEQILAKRKVTATALFVSLKAQEPGAISRGFYCRVL